MKGVANIDLVVSELLSEVTYFKEGHNAYRFLIEKSGRFLQLLQRFCLISYMRLKEGIRLVTKISVLSITIIDILYINYINY